MNFDIFNEIKFVHKDLLLKTSKTAERSIMVSPYNALANARTALEILCKGLRKENSIKQICAKDGNPNLATMVETCIGAGLFKNADAARHIRVNGNNTLHANSKCEKIHIVNEENVKIALKSVRNLYNLMGEAFFKQIGQVEFDENKIPFGFYEIVRVVPKAQNEVVFGNYNYFVKDQKENYYYFQILCRNSSIEENNDLGKRGILTINRIKEDKARKSYLLNVHYPSNLLAESDRDYIAYSVYEDSMLLSEIKEGQLTEKQILYIAIDLTNVLIELKNIGKGIYLRNIQPGNVIITPDGENYMAAVVNMETAKIEGYEATVSGSMRKLIPENPYLPFEVRNGNAGDAIQWDKVDIYSVAKIMVYCKNSSIVKEEMNSDDIYNNFSDEVAVLLDGIFNTSINLIDGVEVFKEKLENALVKLA
jgi:hypothetical protein